MLEVLRWSWQFAEARDTAVARRYGELMQGITNPLVHEVLVAGMNMRMIMAALRRRRHGLTNLMNVLLIWLWDASQA